MLLPHVLITPKIRGVVYLVAPDEIIQDWWTEKWFWGGNNQKFSRGWRGIYVEFSLLLFTAFHRSPKVSGSSVCNHNKPKKKKDNKKYQVLAVCRASRWLLLNLIPGVLWRGSKRGKHPELLPTVSELNSDFFQQGINGVPQREELWLWVWHGVENHLDRGFWAVTICHNSSFY